MRFSLLATLAALVLAAPLPALAADGEAVYAGKCAQCHGADGTGDTPVGKVMGVKSLVTPKWAAEDNLDALRAKLAAHTPAQELKPEELEALAAHVRRLASP